MASPLLVQAPVCAGLSAVSAGLCGFGDALLFHSCMLMWHAAEARPLDDATLRFSVQCTAVMTCVFLPLTIYLARAHLRQCAPYGLAQAVTGLCMVPVGSAFLFLPDLSAVKVCAGVLFAAVASYLLVKSVRDEAREAREIAAQEGAAKAAGAPEAAAAAAATAVTAASDVEVEQQLEQQQQPLPLQLPPPPAPSGRAFIPWPEPPPEGEQDACSLVHPPRAAPAAAACCHPCSAAQRAIDARCAPALGPHFSPSHTLGVLLCSGVGAGFLNGLLGVGGPPQMIAFALLQATKELSRGTSCIYSCLEVPLRAALLALGPQQTALAPSAARGAFAAVAGAAGAGFLLGNWARQYADTRAILRVMLALTLLSGSMLVGALERPAVAAGYGVGALVLLAALVALRRGWGGGG
jgi:uncharacterized membrane protein YfcA